MKNLIFANLSQALDNIKNNSTDLSITTILNWIYSISGIIAVGYIVYGAVNYVNSNGDAAKVRQATQSVLWAVIGLVVIILAASITNFVLSAAVLK